MEKKESMEMEVFIKLIFKSINEGYKNFPRLKKPDFRPFAKGMTVSRPNYDKNSIDLNFDILKSNGKDAVANAIKHACAHLITNSLYESRSHDHRWENVMIVLGANPDKTYDYYIPQSSTISYTYRCDCMMHDVPASLHDRINAHHGIFCTYCGSTMKYVG